MLHNATLVWNDGTCTAANEVFSDASFKMITRSVRKLFSLYYKLEGSYYYLGLVVQLLGLVIPTCSKFNSSQSNADFLHRSAQK